MGAHLARAGRRGALYLSGQAARQGTGSSHNQVRARGPHSRLASQKRTNGGPLASMDKYHANGSGRLDIRPATGDVCVAGRTSVARAQRDSGWLRAHVSPRQALFARQFSSTCATHAPGSPGRHECGRLAGCRSPSGGRHLETIGGSAGGHWRPVEPRHGLGAPLTPAHRAQGVVGPPDALLTKLT